MIFIIVIVEHIRAEREQIIFIIVNACFAGALQEFIYRRFYQNWSEHSQNIIFMFCSILLKTLGLRYNFRV